MQHRDSLLRASHFALAGVVYVALANACAPGGDEVAPSGPASAGSTGASGSISSTTSSSGTDASSGPGPSSSSSGEGGSSDGGAGGDGGVAEGGSGGAVTGGGGSGGGAPSGTVLLLAGGGANLFAGEFHPQGGWTTTTLTDVTNKAPAVVLTSATTGVGMIRSTANAGELRYTTFSAGTWSPLAAVGPSITTQSQPALGVSGVVARLVFHGDNFKHYFGSYNANWAPANEPIGDPVQSFGPSAASITTVGPDVVIAFAGDNGDLYDQARLNNVWQNSTGHGLGDVVSMTPAIAAMSAGVEIMIVFARKSDKKLLWTGKISSSWTVPQEIDMAFAIEPPALVALPGGDAVLAFRGLDGKPYASRYEATNTPPWSVPAAVANPNPSIASAPALAAGVGGVDCELAFAEQGTGVAYHTRLSGMTWSAPAPIGGVGVTYVGLASSP